MKSLFNKSVFSCPSSLTRVSTALILLAMLAMSGNVWADGTVTTPGGATWTYGTEQGTSVWYWDGGDNQDSRTTSQMTDIASYGGTGFTFKNPTQTDEISRCETAKAVSNRYRVVVQKIKYAIDVPAYTSVKTSYRLITYIRCTAYTNYYCGAELFDWGTTDHTTQQTYNTENSTTKSGKLNGVDYCISSQRYWGKSDTQNEAKDRTWTFDNKSGATETKGYDYLALMAFGRRNGTADRNINTYLRYSNESITYTYYSTVTFDANGGEGSMSAQSITSTSTSSTTALNANAFSRRGYAFVGWNTAADGSGTSYTDKEAFKAYNESTRGGKGPVTLYAQWQMINYTITLMDGETQLGVLGANEPFIRYGSSNFCDISWNLPTKVGYTFAGFYDANGQLIYASSGKCVNDGKYWKDNKWQFTDSENAILYARWTKDGSTAPTDATITQKQSTLENGNYNYWNQAYNNYEWQRAGYNLTDKVGFVNGSITTGELAKLSTTDLTEKVTNDNLSYAVTVKPLTLTLKTPKYTKTVYECQFKSAVEVEDIPTIEGEQHYYYHGVGANLVKLNTIDQYADKIYYCPDFEDVRTTRIEAICAAASTSAFPIRFYAVSPVETVTVANNGAAEGSTDLYFAAQSYFIGDHTKKNLYNNPSPATMTFSYTAVPTYTYYATVTFDGNGATSGSMGVQNIEGAANLTNNAFSKTGATFLGWSTSQAATEATWTNGAVFSAQNGEANEGRGPITLYAVWGSYQVSFHANGGGGTMSNKTNIAMDEEFEIPANGFTAPTFTVSFNNVGGEDIASKSQLMTFNGWEDHGDIVGSDGNTYTYTEYDGAYYANKNVDVLEILGGWKYDKYAILSHYIDNGKTEGRKPLNPDGVRGTYLAGNRSWTDGNGVVRQSNVNMLKRLTTTPGYTVPFYAQWAGTITLPTPASRTAYEFLGWYDGENRVGGAGDNYTPTQNVTLTSKWKESSYYISFDANGGTGSMATQTVNSFSDNFITPENSFGAPTYTVTFENEKGEPVEPVSRLMAFNGWEDHGEINFEYEGEIETYTFENFDAPFYANTYGDLMEAFGYNKLKLINHYATYTIHGKETRIAKGYPAGTYPAGATVSNLTNTANYTVPLYAQWAATITLPTPTRSGNYLFDGWYDGETRVGGAGSTYIMTTNTTLKAKWVKYYYETGAGAWSELEKWTLRTDDGSVRHSATALPTESSPVVVRTALTINSEVACYSLTIEDGGSVTIAATGGLSVGAGGVTGAEASNFRIQSSTANQGYFRMSPSATTTMPAATVEYATKGTLDTGADKDATWQYFGVPCSANMTVDHTMWLNQWDVNSGWVKKAQGADHSLQPWTGYSITQYGQPTYTFSGTLLSGNQTINLTGTDATQGMNLIANSYSAPIDVTKFEAGDFTGEAIYTFYIYNAGSWNEWEKNKGVTPSQSNHAPGTYTAIPAFTASMLAGEQTLIAPMQAIMIQLQGEKATINFNYAKHVWGANGTSGSSMTDPIRAPHRAAADPADELTARVRLSVGSAGSGVDHLYLLESPDFTGGYDNGYDAPKMATRGLVNLYTTVPEGMLAVDAKDQLENTYIGFAAGSDSEYTLHFSAVLGTEYYLLDQQTRIYTQMAEGAYYDFSATPNSIDDQRFIILRETPEGPGISTSLPNVSVSESSVTEIYTISGQRMNMPLSELPQGIYIIRQGQTVNKIAIQ